MRLVMSGLDYNLAPISLREPLSFTRTQAGEVLRRIYQENDGVSGCVLISTCNRTELYLATEAGADPRPDELLCRAVHLDYEPFAGAFVIRRGGEAARHLMEVAGGLKSQIWGEDQIVTQVKAAILLAREMHTADPVLETLFRNAVSAGKEMKTKVRLRGVSASAAERAVNVLRAAAGSLDGLRALVIGNGEMGRLAATLLGDAGCAVSVTLRTYRHGETIVPPGCGVVAYDDRAAAMDGMDIVLSATTSPHYTVTAEQVAALKKPPAFVVDLAMPRDVQPAVGELAGVTLFNVDTLGAETRRSNIPPEVTDILDDYMARFYDWLNYRKCLPAIEDLKDAITDRVLTYPEMEDGLEQDKLVELAVGRAVDLMTGGLKEKFTPEDLVRCVEKIKVHTAARPTLVREKEASDDGESLSFSTVC